MVVLYGNGVWWWFADVECADNNDNSHNDNNKNLQTQWPPIVFLFGIPWPEKQMYLRSSSDMSVCIRELFDSVGGTSKHLK